MKLHDPLEIPCSSPISGTLRVPGSKSLTNRAILIASLAQGESILRGCLCSDDTFYMEQAWKNLGVHFEKDNDIFKIHGCAGKFKPYSESIFIGNSGTTVRFLSAALTLGHYEYVLTGNERMQERPILDLIHALQQMGGEIQDQLKTGCPPVKILGKGLKGGEVKIPGEKSSQYISAVMMAAPYAQNDVKIQIEGDLVSETYVEMTKRIMAEFGVQVNWDTSDQIHIPAGQIYQAQEYEIEGDASSASYFMGMAAITKGEITLTGLSEKGSQGDLGLLNVLERMGCQITRAEKGITIQGGDLKAIEVDMLTMSDVAPTLAVVALFAKGKTIIKNVANMRIKECDRIRAIVVELQKLGAVVEEWEDGLSIEGMGDFHGAELGTYDDHRMAMSFSLAGLKIPGVKIQEPECVKKTYPEFYDHFFSLLQAQ